MKILKSKKFIGIVIIAIIILAVLYINKSKMVYLLVETKLGRNIVEFFIGNDYKNSILDEEFNDEKIHINADLDIPQEYTNIALFGVDSREGDLGINAHSDSIIVLSINNTTGDIKMLSLYRDTFVQFYMDENVQYNQASTANYYGGPESAVNMLNKMLDLNITDYITVNFAGLAQIIDAMGGVDIKINEEEMNLINGYLTETRQITGLESPDISSYGEVHLNGLQATAYCRNRYTDFTKVDGTVVEKDYARSERQRYILALLIDKIKDADSSQLYSLKEILMQKDNKLISTSMTLEEALQLADNALNCNIIGSEGFPKEHIEKYVIGNGECIVADDLQSNVIMAHQYLFSEEDYEPTDTVVELSQILKEIEK